MRGAVTLWLICHPKSGNAFVVLAGQASTERHVQSEHLCALDSGGLKHLQYDRSYLVSPKYVPFHKAGVDLMKTNLVWVLD